MKLSASGRDVSESFDGISRTAILVELTDVYFTGRLANDLLIHIKSNDDDERKAAWNETTTDVFPVEALSMTSFENIRTTQTVPRRQQNCRVHRFEFNRVAVELCCTLE